MIDDDVTFCELTNRYLTVEGYRVTLCHKPHEGLKSAQTGSFDLILLDVMMPQISGFDVLAELRKISTIPVILCTSLDEDVNEIVGLETGADDYVKKSAHPRVLLAKINAVLRRANDEFKLEGNAKTLVFDDVEINTSARTVMVNEKHIELTVSEFNILAYIIQTPSEPKSKQEISEKALGKKITPHDRSVDTHISRIRNKLGNRPNKTARIRTIQGFGYQWNTDD